MARASVRMRQEVRVMTGVFIFKEKGTSTHRATTYHRVASLQRRKTGEGNLTGYTGSLVGSIAEGISEKAFGARHINSQGQNWHILTTNAEGAR